MVSYDHPFRLESTLWNSQPACPIYVPLSRYDKNHFIQYGEYYARCDWSLPMNYSIRVQTHGWRHGKLVFLCFAQHGARFWKCLQHYFGLFWMFSRSCLQVTKTEKSRKNISWWLLNALTGRRKIFTTVAIVCHHYKRLAVLQNVFVIILLWASKDLEKPFGETVYKVKRK